MVDPRTVFPDNIYHTLTSTNNSSQPDILRFASNNSNNVVPNPIMYYCLVTKFVLPNTAFPLMEFKNSDGAYYFIMGGTKYLVKIPSAWYRGNITGPDPPFVSGFATSAPIYSVQNFMDIMTVATGGVYEFSLQTDGRIRIDSIVSNNLVLSPKLMGLFPTLESTFIKATGDYKIFFRGTNPYFAVQEAKALYAFNDIRSILMTTDDLPIQHQGFISNRDATQKIKILNEFPPIYSQGEDIDKTDWLFESTEYRPIDMNSQEAFASFTFDIRIVRKDNTISDYVLLPGATATATFRFVKKALFNNEYNLAGETARIKQNPQAGYHKRY